MREGAPVRQGVGGAWSMEAGQLGLTGIPAGVRGAAARTWRVPTSARRAARAAGGVGTVFY